MSSISEFPRPEQYESVVCCLCGETPHHYAVDFRGNHIAICRKCDFLFVSPRLRFEGLLEQVYKDNYYIKNDPHTSERENCAYYLNRIKTYRSDKSVRGSLFDVGAGDGLLLETALSYGWEVEGQDIQPAQVEFLRKKLRCTVYLGFLEELEIAKKFDVITLIHVIEHTLNPVEFLRKCESLLKPQGILYAVFPNTGSLNDRIKNFLSAYIQTRNQYKHLATDHHLWFFTPATARKLVKKTGLQILSLKTIFSPKKINFWNRPFRNFLSQKNLGAWIEMILTRPD